MKTAVEWLYNLSKQRELDKFDFQQAKEMEKEQIKNAWLNSLTKGDYNSADEYYNENYKLEIEKL
jgi:hypothetical protein